MWFILYRLLAVVMQSGVAKIRRIGWELLKTWLGPSISPCPQLWHSQQLTFPLLNSTLEFIPWRVSGLGNTGTVKGRSSLSIGGFEWMYIWMMNPSPIQSLFPHSGSRRVEAKPLLKAPGRRLEEPSWGLKKGQGKRILTLEFPQWKGSNGSSYREVHNQQASLLFSESLSSF